MIHTTIDKSQKSTALFLDIAKAFDKVDHNILLSKLRHIGIRGTLLDWFESFIRNRYQVVRINKATSSQALVNCGVPQGSVLGPLLFLIYFNSIFEINLIGVPTAYADDLALTYITNGYPLEINSLVETDLKNLSKWFYYHKLALSSKSKIMFFTKQGEVFLTNPIIYHVCSCDKKVCLPHCFALEPVSEFRYLGLTIDAKLNWVPHLNNIRKSVIFAVHKFYKLRKCCPNITLRKLYHALVESIIMYGISSWGGTYYANIEDLYIAQKRIIKLIYHCPRRTPTIPLFRQLNLLPLRYLYVYKVLKMFFIRSNSFHSRLSHVYYTRNPNNFAGVRCNSEKLRRFYLYMAPYFYRILPNSIKQLTSVRMHQFNRETRSWLLGIDDIEKFF